MIPVLLIGLLTLSLAGCASSSSEKLVQIQSSPVPMTGLPSPPVLHADHTEQWTGVYEGTAGVFIRTEGAWHRGEPMHLVIEAVGLRRIGKALQIRWDFPHPVSRAYLGPFHVPVTMIGPTQMAGERVYEHSLERGSKKEFSFARDGRKVSGRIKEYRRENLGGPFLPRNEWVVELTRTDGPPSAATPGTEGIIRDGP